MAWRSQRMLNRVKQSASLNALALARDLQAVVVRRRQHANIYCFTAMLIPGHKHEDLPTDVLTAVDHNQLL